MSNNKRLKVSYVSNQYGDVIKRYDIYELQDMGCNSNHALELKKCMDRLLKQEIYSWTKDDKHIITMPETDLEYAYYTLTSYVDPDDMLPARICDSCKTSFKPKYKSEACPYCYANYE